MQDPQSQVAAFVRDHDLAAPPAYRLLDLVSETGELAKEATVSTRYGAEPDAIDLSADELGDVYFAVLALAEAADVDAAAALESALSKYEDRLSDRGSAGSGDRPGE